MPEAEKSYQRALELEPNNADALEGMRKVFQAKGTLSDEERRAQALQDPEVQEILKGWLVG